MDPASSNIILSIIRAILKALTSCRRCKSSCCEIEFENKSSSSLPHIDRNIIITDV